MPAFTEYNPAVHSDANVLGAIVTPTAGMTIVPGSVQMRWGIASSITLGGPDGDSPGLPGFPNLPGFPDLPGMPSAQMVRSISFYDGSISSLGIGAGLLLSTGGALPPGINTSESYSGVFEADTSGESAPVDAELTAVAHAAFAGAGVIRDTTGLSFSVNVTDPTIRGLRFDVVFASEEYPEFVDSDFVDIAAVIVNGANYALFNQQAAQPLSVVSENLALGNFRDNAGGTIPLEYDGVSRALSVVAPLEQGINTIRIAVADTGDEVLDSALFVSRLQVVDYVGFGLAPVIEVAQPTPGSAHTTQDQTGNQIYTFLQGFTGTIAFGAGTGAGSGTAQPGGNDVVDGSDAFVTVKIDGSLASLLGLELMPDGLKLELPGGMKVLNDVERIAFDDLFVAFDTQRGDPAWNAYALLKAVLPDLPPPSVLTTWVLKADQAADPQALASQILDQLLPGITPEALITVLCQNLLDITPSPEMVSALAGLIGPGGAFPTDEAFLYAVASNETLNSMVAFTGLPAFLDPSVFSALG